LSNTDRNRILARRMLANSLSNQKASITVALAAMVAGLVLIFVVLAEIHSGNFWLASATLLVGALAILIVAIRALYLAQEHRLHRLLTAMTAAEQARTQAEAAAREKSRLLATMSHEIRTPLHGVIGMLELLLETELSAEQQNYTATAKSSSRTLLSIIDEILDTAKVRSAATQKKIDVTTLVENVTELLAPRAHAKGIEISAHISNEVPDLIEGDDLHVRQILFNLAGNAVKFTEKGGVAIDVHLDEKDQLVIDITDSGIGMTEEEAARVFEEYVQANAATSKRFGGTGLGLAISRKLVNGLGGTLTVTSQVGNGSRFTVTLPGPYSRASSTDCKPLANRHFALALQSDVTAQHLKTRLTELGAVVTQIGDNANLQDWLGAPKPDCDLISDISYATVLKKWAQSSEAKSPARPRIWMMMKVEERRENRSFLGKPFAGYLLKPLRRATLLAQLTPRETDATQHASTALRAIAARAKSRAKPKNGMMVLLAEDNPVNALLIRTMLERNGHKVHHVNNGLAALEFFDQNSEIDLALFDIEMPKLDGFETARAIRSRESQAAGAGGKFLPILALTANARIEDIAACLEAGMNDHLAKPFDQVDLEEKINLLIALRIAA
jgi:signal transduction histidine kinase/CheY-like chemotaxis protein